MTTIVPTTLPSVGTTQYSSYVWAWRSSTTTHEIYDLQTTAGSFASPTEGVYSIKVGKSGETDYNTWTDDGSSNPMDVTISGSAFSAVIENSDGTVSLYGNSGGTNMLLYVFTKPTTASWISSGGGTGTEGSSTPSGSTYINSQGQIVFVIDSTSPSSDGNIVYKIFRRPLNQAMQQAYVVPHTSGSTPTEFTIGLNYSLYDRWELRVESSTALVQSSVLAVYKTYKTKVFRNFW